MAKPNSLTDGGRLFLGVHPSLSVLTRSQTKYLGKPYAAFRLIFHLKVQPFAEFFAQSKQARAYLFVPSNIASKVVYNARLRNQKKASPLLRSCDTGHSLSNRSPDLWRNKFTECNQFHRGSWIEHLNALIDLLVFPRGNNFVRRGRHSNSCPEMKLLHEEVIDGNHTQQFGLPSPRMVVQRHRKNAHQQRDHDSDEGRDRGECCPVKATGRCPGNARNHHFCSDHRTISIWVRRHCAMEVTNG